MLKRYRVMVVAALALAAMAGAAGPARADEPMVWLHVDAASDAHDNVKVKVTVPLSLIDVVVESLDTSRIVKEIRIENGIDLAKMWRQVRNMDLDEFVNIDSDRCKMKVYKDRQFFRVTAQKNDYDEANVDVKIPLPVMDYLFEEHRDGFRFSDLVDTLRGRLPLTIVEVTHRDGHVTVWLDEK